VAIAPHRFPLSPRKSNYEGDSAKRGTIDRGFSNIKNQPAQPSRSSVAALRQPPLPACPSLLNPPSVALPGREGLYNRFFRGVSRFYFYVVHPRSFPAIAPYPLIGYNKVGLRKKWLSQVIRANASLDWILTGRTDTRNLPSFIPDEELRPYFEKTNQLLDIEDDDKKNMKGWVIVQLRKAFPEIAGEIKKDNEKEGQSG
jgi:hypothetical protein